MCPVVQEKEVVTYSQGFVSTVDAKLPRGTWLATHARTAVATAQLQCTALIAGQPGAWGTAWQLALPLHHDSQLWLTLAGTVLPHESAAHMAGSI